jgi:uncharacterized protein YegJ (DUF2314 family)
MISHEIVEQYLRDFFLSSSPTMYEGVLNNRPEQINPRVNGQEDLEV